MRQFLLHLVAPGLHPGAAAGSQNDCPGHITSLFPTQEGFKLCPQSTRHQHGLIALLQHFRCVRARKDQLGLRQQESGLCFLKGTHAVGVSGLYSSR